MPRIFIAICFLLTAVTTPIAAAPFNEGAKECNECHEREVDVWKQTPHFKSYKKLHKSKEAKKILKAVGEKSMKRSDTCVQCHYTKIQKSASAKAKVKSGPSCESCHNASSDWREIHNDFGGPKLEAKDETPEHKVKRLADAEAAGMIASRMVYRIAGQCMQCHGLANPNIDGETLSKMLDADHPIEPDFEIVRYSQGKLRHRFVPPDVEKNSELDAKGTARLFLGGQAAMLVYATAAKDKTGHEKFTKAMQQRIKTARSNLALVKDKVPEAAALLLAPTKDNALKFEAAIEDMDLSAAVSGAVPEKSDYK